MKTSDTNISSVNESCALYAVLASGFFVALGVGLFSFSLPLMSLDERVSGAWLGSGFASYYFARLVIAPLAGMWADHAGARRPLLWALAVGALSPLTYWLSPSLAVLYGIQCTMGVVAGFVRPVGLAAIGGNADKKNLSKWFAVHTLFFHGAMFIGPLLGGWLFLERTMEPILMGVVVCMGLAFACIMVFMPISGVNKKVKQEQSDGFVAASQNRSVLPLLSAIAGRTLGIGLVTAFYPIVLSTVLGRNGLVTGLLFSLPSLAVCLGLPLIGRMAINKSRSVLTFGGMLLSAISIYGLGVSDQLWQFVCWGIAMGAGAAFSIPASMSLTSSLFPRQGKGFGVVHAVSGVGFMAGPLLGGMIVQYGQGLELAFLVGALVGVICCIPLFVQILGEKLYFARSITWVLGTACVLFFCAVGVLQINTKLTINVDDGFFRYTDTAMGTIVHLTLVADSRKAADDASRKVMAFMRELQKDFDYRNARGSVGSLNYSAGKNWVTPSDRAYHLIRRTVQYSALSGGVFDPTIGALTTSPLYYALDETIARAKKGLVDYRKVQFDETRGRIRLARQGMALDLGGIAKGTIIDASVKMLRSLGIQAGIVEAGGDFYCFGERDWTVGIRHPRLDTVYSSIMVREQGVCGSGDYQQFVVLEEQGKSTLRHHIINPVDMEPADKVAGVTVVAESAEKADVLATTLFIMGGDEGIRFMKDNYPRASAMWFKSDLSVVVSDNFPK